MNLMLGCRMSCRAVLLFLVLVIASALATGQSTPHARITKQTREQIVHAFAYDLVYVRTNFPMGKVGLKLRNGTLTPNGPELQQLMSLWGPAAKAGDQARITETFHRTDFDTLEWSETIDDPKMYTRPWETMKLPMRLHDPGTDLMEYYCSPVEAENYNKAFEAGASQK